MNKIGSWKARLGEGKGVNLWGKLLFIIKTESMIDIFSQEYQLEKARETARNALERAKKATREENIRYLMEMGICDENGQYTPEYEDFQFLKWDNLNQCFYV